MVRAEFNAFIEFIEINFSGEKFMKRDFVAIKKQMNQR